LKGADLTVSHNALQSQHPKKNVFISHSKYASLWCKTCLKIHGICLNMRQNMWHTHAWRCLCGIHMYGLVCSNNYKTKCRNYLTDCSIAENAHDY